MMSPDPFSYWIVLLDIEDFSLRPENAQATLHEELYEVVGFALGRAGLVLADCPVQDRGDGMLILVPVGTSPTRLLRELQRGLEDALLAHRARYNEDHRMRLRVGLNQGLVIRQGERWTGTAINDLARLVDAGPVRRVLAEARRAQLVLVVSESVHRAVVLGRYPGIDPAAYLPADFVTKHGEPRRGWVTVPGYAAPPGLPADPGEPPGGATGGASALGGTAGRAGGGTDSGSPVPPPTLKALGRDDVAGDLDVRDPVRRRPADVPAAEAVEPRAEPVAGPGDDRPGGQGAYDVFVSYADAESGAAERLASRLQEASASVFLVRWVAPGLVPLLEAERALAGAVLGVLLFGRTTMDDVRIAEEYATLLQHAHLNGLRFVPAPVDDVALPAFAAIRQPVDLREPGSARYDAEVGRLVRIVRGRPPAPGV